MCNEDRSRRPLGIPAAFGAVAVLCLCGTVQARFRAPDTVPVDRLVRNVTEYIEKHPKDARGYFTLARCHSLAVAFKSRVIRVYEGRRPGELPYIDHLCLRRVAGEGVEEAELRGHLKAALENFEKAIGMAPENALYRLGLAYTMETGGGVANQAPPKVEVPTLPPEEAKRLGALVSKLAAEDAEVRAEALAMLGSEGEAALSVLLEHVDDEKESVRAGVRSLVARLWKKAAREEYLEAYRLSIEEDLAVSEMPIRGVRTLVAYEAGDGYVRLTAQCSPDEADEEYVQEVNANLLRLRGKQRRRITPIVFPLDRARPLRELLHEKSSVAFDLDGDGVPERGAWVKPTTALLVWDPLGRGEIRSGRQLLGSVTWWIFWRDGYEALAALDDDGDGWLEGKELRGLAAWRDANGNGVSEPGEVRPLRDLGVVRLAAHATGTAEGCPANSEGVHLADGQKLPSYDWHTTRSPRWR